MIFKERFTTLSKISEDKEGIEIKKIQISEEAFLNAEMMNELITKLEHVRQSFIK
jgi:hypothetical protein